MEAVTDFEHNEETEFGRNMFANLLVVHAELRRDLEAVEDLTADLADGLAGSEARARVIELKTNGPLWKLKNDCLQFCEFLHFHHNREDTLLFPRLRLLNPDLAPEVAKLERDHETVTELLTQIESATDRLAVRAAPEARDELSSLLTEMRTHLLAHLEYEEQVAGPTIRRMISFD